MSEHTISVCMARKAAAAILVAIEIYNRPSNQYRIETFSLLVINAWEVLLKAKIVKDNGNEIQSIHHHKQNDKSVEYENDALTNEPRTISLNKAIKTVNPPKEIIDNIKGIQDIRNHVAHTGSIPRGFHQEITQYMTKYGTASVFNFIRACKDWFNEDIELPYIMPVGHLGKLEMTDKLSTSQRDLIQNLQKLSKDSSSSNSEYFVAITIKTMIVRGLNGEASFGYTKDPNAPRVQVSDDEFFERYPASYKELAEACREAIPGFKQNQTFHSHMKKIKDDPDCAYARKLNPRSSRSLETTYYNLKIALTKLKECYNQKN